jgi:hypothetical protein
MNMSWRSGARKWFLLLGDDRTLRSHFGIQLGEGLLIFRQVVFVKNCFDGALGHARFAVDAFIRVDVQHLLTLVKAFDGAHDNTVGVLAAKTRLGNYVSHESITPKKANHFAQCIVRPLMVSRLILVELVPNKFVMHF